MTGKRKSIRSAVLPRAAAALLICGLLTSPTVFADGSNVTLGQYEGIQVQKVSGIPEITDDAVDNNIQVILNGFAEKTEVDRAAKKGDAVTVDYTVTVDDKPVEGAGMVDLEVVIGDTAIFSGFDTSLTGKKKGDSYTLEHTYNSAYGSSDLAGKTAVFHIDVKSVKEIELPELTDDFVQKVSTKSKTVSEYRDEVRAVLEANNRDYVMSELKNVVWQKVLGEAVIDEYPEDLVKTEKDAFYAYYQTGADTYDMSFDEFLEKLQISKESFEKQAEESARSNVRENLVAAAIAEEIGLSFTDEEYKTEYDALAKELGFDSTEAMLEEAPSEEYLKNMVLRNKVIEYLVDHCEQVEEK